MYKPITKLTYYLTSLLIFIFAAGCSKHDAPAPAPAAPIILPPPVIPDKDIYVCGNLLTQSSTRAVYWKNGSVIKLGDPNINTAANAIFVNGNDIYIAGYEQVNNKNKAVYWKNGNMVVLDDGMAMDIAVQNNDIYVSGHFDNYVYDIYTPPVMIASYWKNGVITKLQNPIADNSNGGPNSDALTVAVSGNNVHVGGYGSGAYGGGPYVAVYWKNTVPTQLTPYFAGFGNLEAKSMIKDLVLEGDDVYTAGSIMPATGILANPADIGGAVYWKNGKGFQLFNNSIYSVNNAIAVNGSTVYTAGFDSGSAFYAKDSTIFSLNISGQIAYPSGIALYQGDVYISGYAHSNENNALNSAVYWKNGTLFTLATNAEATGIAVIKHQQ